MDQTPLFMQLLRKTGIFPVISILALTCLSFHNQPNPGKSLSNLVYNDHIYNDNVKTVKLYNQNSNPGAVMDAPYTSLQQNSPFMLEFDVLNEDAYYYQAKVIQCNWDWTPSQLNAIEYMDTYNEIDYESYNYSIDTKIPYTHYRFIIPALKLSGNYLVYVYDRDDPDRIILSRRLMIYDNKVQISPEVTLSNGISERTTNQQINFTLAYPSLQVMNPIQDFKVVIRQNYSWFNDITGLKPTQVNQVQKILQYNHFNLENNFGGGNEYRYFDMRSAVSPGINIDHISTKAERIDAFLGIDKSRAAMAYGQWHDMDGAYYASSIDQEDVSTEANYIYTHFFLQTGTKLPSDVYIFGEISFRQPLPQYKMKYDSNLGGYTGDFILKEGYYDYIYITPGNQYLLEGNHFETENTYDIIVYYRAPSKIYDQIAGYIQFKSNNH